MAGSTEVNYIDTFQTRFMNSFVNLTKADSTKYPAITTFRQGYNDTELGGTPVLSSYCIYDQYALRVVSLSGLDLLQVA
jgi:hypothetical protein